MILLVRRRGILQLDLPVRSDVAHGLPLLAILVAQVRHAVHAVREGHPVILFRWVASDQL